MQAPLPPMLRALMQAILPIETNNLATLPARAMIVDTWGAPSVLRSAHSDVSTPGSRSQVPESGFHR